MNIILDVMRTSLDLLNNMNVFYESTSLQPFNNVGISNQFGVLILEKSLGLLDWNAAILSILFKCT